MKHGEEDDPVLMAALLPQFLVDNQVFVFI